MPCQGDLGREGATALTAALECYSIASSFGATGQVTCLVARSAGQPEASTSTLLDSVSRRLRIELQDSITLLIPVTSIHGLNAASASEVDAVKLLVDGYARHSPSLDVDATMLGLVSEVFDTQRRMRHVASGLLSQAGLKGGSTSTEAKRASSHANSRLGDRLRKHVLV